MAHRIAGEVDVEDRIKEVLERFVGQRFNDVTITAVKRQYDVDGRRADIAEPIRALVLTLAGRRLARAREARREAIVGEEREAVPRGRRARRRAGREGGSRVVRRLDEFLQRS
jgi:hypothetical protein